MQVRRSPSVVYRLLPILKKTHGRLPPGATRARCSRSSQDFGDVIERQQRAVVTSGYPSPANATSPSCSKTPKFQWIGRSGDARRFEEATRGKAPVLLLSGTPRATGATRLLGWRLLTDSGETTVQS